MSYSQITTDERYKMSELRKQGFSNNHIARALGRHRSTIGREFLRNSRHGCYRPSKAVEMTQGRRSRSRRNAHFSCTDWKLVYQQLYRKLSPEQIAAYLKQQRTLSISHETIYQHIWDDKHLGGSLYTHLRQANKLRRKRYRSYDSRGTLANKPHISSRPTGADNRSRFGHWEIDTVQGKQGDSHCIVTLVERKSGFTLIGKLANRTAALTAQRVVQLIRHYRDKLPFLSITADNGTEFHDYLSIQQSTGVRFYFANPYHSWERGTNENTNGLIRQYLPKRQSMRYVSQQRCNSIAHQLNKRPRKRLLFQTPYQCFPVFNL